MYSMPKMRSAKSTAGSCVGLYLVYIVIHCPERFPLNRSRKRMDGEKFKMTKMASGHVSVVESRPAVRLHAGLATPPRSNFLEKSAAPQIPAHLVLRCKIRPHCRG